MTAKIQRVNPCRYRMREHPHRLDAPLSEKTCRGESDSFLRGEGAEHDVELVYGSRLPPALLTSGATLGW